MKYTEHFKLKKPDKTDNADISIINENMDAIDAACEEIKDKVSTFGKSFDFGSFEDEPINEYGDLTGGSTSQGGISEKTATVEETSDYVIKGERDG